MSINSLKYLRSTTLGYKDIEIKKSEFVAKTQLFRLFTDTTTKNESNNKWRSVVYEVSSFVDNPAYTIYIYINISTY